MRKMVRAEEDVYRAVQMREIEIDSKGRIWRLGARRGIGVGESQFLWCKRRRTESINSGYFMVKVMLDGKRHQAQGHRLVYRHFFGPIPDGLTINHKNGKPLDNRPQNLEAVTYSENCKHAFRKLGRKPASKRFLIFTMETHGLR